MKIHEYIKKLQTLPEKKKMLIMFVVVGLVAMIMGFFWVRSAANSLSKLQSVNLPKIDIPQEAIDSLSDTTGEIVDNLNQVVVEENLQTADWKTYTNSEYGFEFKYPKEVIVKEDKNVTGIYYTVTEFNKEQLKQENFGWNIRAYKNDDKKGLESWFYSTFSTNIDKDCKSNIIESNINIAGTSTILFGTGQGLDSPERCENSGYYTLSIDKLTVIKWELFQDPEYFDVIFPTFKFINPKS